MFSVYVFMCVGGCVNVRGCVCMLAGLRGHRELLVLRATKSPSSCCLPLGRWAEHPITDFSFCFSGF